MGILKLNNFEGENNGKAEMPAVTMAEQSGVQKAATITVTTYREVDTTDMLQFVTTEDSGDVLDDFPDELRLFYKISWSTIGSAVVHMNTTKLPKWNNIKGFLIELTTKSGATGQFGFEGDWRDAEPNKKYRFDISDKVKTNNIVRFEMRPSGDNTFIEFYTTGVYAPKVLAVVEVEKEPDSLIYNLKEFSLGKKARGYVDLNDGTVSTAVTTFSGEDFPVPLNLTHIYNTNGASGVYGQKWRLNLDKKLISKAPASFQDSEFTFLDELGNKYDFKETYYYVENGKKVSVNKNEVIVDLNGKLSYGGHAVYKHQVCNSYTLIPEIKGFIDTEFLEQRQSERIQIESYVNQLEPNLKTYCAVDLTSNTVLAEFSELTRDEYDQIMFYVSNSSSTLFLSKSEVLQIKSLSGSNQQINLQIEQTDLSIQELEIQIDALNEEMRYLAQKNDQDGVDVAWNKINIAKSRIANSKNQKLRFHEQVFATGKQIEYIQNQAKANLDNVKETFRQFFSKKAELDMLIKHTPVNFLRDQNGIISGFNSNGDLVYICDGYGNYAALQYDPDGKLSTVFDSAKAIVNFEYADNKLKSITDYRGRKVKFVYDQEKLNLTDIIYPDGSKIQFSYGQDGLHTVTYDDGKTAELLYKNGQLQDLILSGVSDNQTKEIARYSFFFSENYASVNDYKGDTSYNFDDTKQIVQISSISNFSVYSLTKISYDYSIGKTVTTEKSSNVNPQTITETEIYDEFDLLISKEVDWQKVSDTVSVKTLTEYSYDLNSRVVLETTTKTFEENGINKNIVSVVKYSYNPNGSLCLTESYVEGEQLSTGINFEQRFYDENGNVIKTVSWNSLDSSTKFYSEQVYAENGQVTADTDESGEVASEYEYISDTAIVNSVKLANGSKIAYGRNPNNDEVTSVTQSTDDGDANTTDIVYENGLPVKVKSGNTVLCYAYDHKGRKTQVIVNGVNQISYSYNDNYSYDGDTESAFISTESQSLVADDVLVTFETTKTGKLDEETGVLKISEETTVDGETVNVKNYDGNDRLVEEYNYILSNDLAVSDIFNELGYNVSTEHFSEENQSNEKFAYYTVYAYDDYGKIKSIGSRLNPAMLEMGRMYSVKEDFLYNEYGLLKTRAIATCCGHEYSFTYKNNAARNLDFVSFGNYRFKPLTDLYGRNTGKEIYDGENRVAAEYISYKKVGDRATNLPSTVWFADGEKVKDNIRYKYDRCGNICEITQNNRLAVTYEYDKLNRLVKEDNKQLGKVFEFVYDTNGNILYKYTTANGETTVDEYEYDGDKLISYNGETSEYNALGKPTRYRGKSISWLYGKYLTEYDGNKYLYDSRGRRLGKNGKQHIYDDAGELICIFEGLQFVYDNAGLTGFIHNKTQYFYRKDIQGNIIAILDETGAVVVTYIYDAWGNHAVLDADGKDITDIEHIGNLNPFRYRGYYYDVETGLYFLQTRYYDPETGRFISQDSVEYAEPETVNGINLYAYCGNNPVMNVDPSGKFFLSLFIAGLVGAVVAAASSAVVQFATTGEVNWAQVGISALFGAVGGMLSFTGIGGVVGQFIIQGALAVGEMYSVAALNGEVSSIGFAQVVATFLFAGALGAIGSKNAAAGFKRIGQIESDFVKYTIRDVQSYGAPVFSTILSRGAKYFAEFVKPFFKQTIITGGITAIANTSNYWIQKLHNFLN
ncbi:MAG: hypothetical protein K2O89_06340 [Clostridia bacterium]|nr:hypothetical protein [Clostridia bacterium]